MAYPNNEGYRNNASHLNERNPSPPFASTPLTNRSRPRFAYSGPPNYPRPGSSAAKPNPGSFSELMRSRYVPSNMSMSDSMINNCGDSMQYMNSTLRTENNSFVSDYDSSNSFQSQNSSLYYSCNESFGAASPRKTLPLLQNPFPPPMDPPLHFQTPQQAPFNCPPIVQTSPVSSKNQFKAPSSVLDSQQKKPQPYYTKPKNPFQKSEWRCELCDIDFTSRHPFKMHFQGAKHAKKLKMQESLQSIQSQVTGKEIVKVGSTFRCDICGVIANSTFQLLTHLDGVKHKAKVTQMEEEDEAQKMIVEGESNTNANGAKKGDVLKEKKAVISILPCLDVPAKKPAVVPPKPVVNPPKPSVNPPKPSFSCIVCNVNLNSKTQYDQHMVGKYHKAKVEGKPLPYSKKNVVRKAFEKAKNPAAEDNTTEVIDLASEETPEVAKTAAPVATTKPVVGILKNKASVPMEPSETENRGKPELSSAAAKGIELVEEVTKPAMKPQTVIGVKTLSSSFIAGEIMK